MTHQFR